MPRDHYTYEKDFKGEIHANNDRIIIIWSHGVMVSTLDFESSDPSSNLGGTSQFCDYFLSSLTKNIQKLHEIGFPAKTCKKNKDRS